MCAEQTTTIVNTQSDNVVVGVRIRPLNELEEKEGNPSVAFKKVGKQMIREVHNASVAGIQGKEYVYDHVFGPKNSTFDVYERVAKPLIEKSMEGFNGTIFAYGQTSSGKTHTLMGNDSDPGINIHAVKQVFSQIADTQNTEFLVRMSYLEIYNEEIGDLLEPLKRGSTRVLRIKDDKKKGPIVEGLRESRVTSPEDALQLIYRGESNRSYGSTAMNEMSSRSHVLLKMIVESREIDSSTTSHSDTVFRKAWSKERPPVKEAAIYLVDLAGSERRRKTGATGQRAREGNAINQSLLSLGTVISKLSEGVRGAHIPYRDSKLTRLLQMSLGGNAKTAMIAAISPAERNRDETVSTLRYASRAKQIVNFARANLIEDEESQLAEARNEIEALKKELEKARANPSLTQVAAEEAEAMNEKLNYLNKVVILSNKLAQAQRNIGNRDKANEIEKDIQAVVTNKRRPQSIYVKHRGMVDQLPSRDQERILKLDKSVTIGSFVDAGLEDDEEDNYDRMKLKEAEKKIAEMEESFVELQQEVTALDEKNAQLTKELREGSNKLIQAANEKSRLKSELEKYAKGHGDSLEELKNMGSMLKDNKLAMFNSEAERKDLASKLEVAQEQAEQLNIALQMKVRFENGFKLSLSSSK